jgi:protein arginine kinase activator
MKCQKCEKQATFHITELAGGKPKELHLCEEHARDYLAENDATEEAAPAASSESLSQQLAVGQTVEQLAKLDKQACPVCGITFFDFRSKGRLGCSHDYVCFEKELEPLLVNIHGETTHVGKRPKRSQGNTDRLTDLIRLRKELKTAVQAEDYEKATKIRDEVRRLEGERKQT